MPSGPIKILIIEDERDVGVYMANLLRALGFQPIQAEGAEDGLAKFRAEHPSLVILDAMLPGDEAHHIYFQLKTNPDLAGIPVVLISSIGRPAMGRFHLWPTGRHLPEPEAFLDKPPEAEDVIDALTRLIGRIPSQEKEGTV
jgi:CheY-like chemotaxis protein